MGDLIKKIRIFLAIFAVAVCGVVPPDVAPAELRIIERIELGAGPETLAIRMSGRTPHRVFQIGSREVVIALKGVRTGKALSGDGVYSTVVQRVSIDPLHGDIVVLNVVTSRPVKGLSSEWAGGGKILSVSLLPVTVPSIKQTPKAAPPRASPPPTADIPLPDLSLKTLEALVRKPGDSIDGLFADLSKDRCMTQPAIRAALSRGETGAWQEAYSILDSYLKTDAAKECLEAAYYLKAYAYYKETDSQAEDGNLEAQNLFKEAVSYYPKSAYAPYGIAALGKINRRLNNFNEAKGYFKVILDSYPGFGGTPEAMMELARVYLAQDKVNLAIPTLEQLIADYPQSPVLPDARLELGKALIEANNFGEALKMLQGLLKSAPRKVYESPDLLLHLGNCYFQMGQLSEARQILLQAVNFFPETPSNHMVLSRIGDIFRDEKQPEKAQKIYEHVVKNFPGSDGFIVSSVRMADYLNRRQEKENLYRMIIKDHPDHPLTRLAYFKLATLLTKEGEHEKSIETLHTFLAKFPGVLKQEAVFALRDAYGGLFEKLTKAEDPTGVLTWYERDKAVINRIDSPELYFLAGKAYLSSHFFGEAADLLQKAYQLFDKNNHSADLLFSLGSSLHQSGRSDGALKILESYARAYPKDPHAAEAYRRMGRILMEKKQYADALKKLRLAFEKTDTKAEKASILVSEAEASKALADFPKAARQLIQAIDLYAAIPEAQNGSLSKLYRNLGDTYLKTKDYLKAADAFAMSLKFNDKKDDPDLRFQLAETYEKGKAVELAGKVYQEIIEMGDPFWARLAQEKLRGIQIETRLKPVQTLKG